MVEKRFPLAVVIEAVDKATAPIRRVSRTVQGLTAPVRAITGRFAQLSKVAGLPKVGAALAGVGRGVANVGSALAGTLLRVTAVAGVASAALFGLVRSYSRAGDSAAKTADRIGLGVEALQELRFAATRAGLTTEQLDKALLDQGKRLGEARAQTGALYTLLQRANPALLDQLTRTHDQAAAFELLVGTLHDTTDAQLRLALANAAFGRAGAKIINLAKDGTKGLDQLRQTARELGLVIGEEDARAAEAFEDALTDVLGALAGLRNLIASALLPVLQDLIESTTAWVMRVRPQVQRFAREFAAGLPEKMRTLVEWFKRAAEDAKPLIAAAVSLVETFGAVNVAALALAVVLGGQLLASVVALVPAIYSLGAALLATPVGWFIGIVAAAIAVGWAFYQSWDDILGYVTFLWENLVAVVQKFMRLARYTVPVQLYDLTRRAAGAVTGRELIDPNLEPGAAREVSAQLDAQLAAAPNRDDRVRVEFVNAPAGTRVSADGAAGLELDVGYSMALP